MENKSKIILMIIIIVLIVCTIVGIGLFSINQNGKSQSLENMQELKDFDITVDSLADLNPCNESDEAFFDFSLRGISKEIFFNEYEIESIELNGNLLNIQDLITDWDYNGFRLYSSNYQNSNTIVVIIKNKNTNERYYKKLSVLTMTAM